MLFPYQPLMGDAGSERLWTAGFLRQPSVLDPDRIYLVRSYLEAVEMHAHFADLRTSTSTGDFWSELGAASGSLRPYVVVDGVLQIPVKGVLVHDFPFAFRSYATGYDYIWRAFERGMADGNVRGIALVIDSPGGMVAGCFDACDKMVALKADSGKPVRAYAAESAYSAAYAIACVADTITVSRTGGVGSVGVVTMHVDQSAALKTAGISVSFIASNPSKTDGNACEPLGHRARRRIQSRIDEMYGIFVDHVAAGRSMSADAVRATEALCFTASEAKSNGLADDIGSLDDSLAAFAADLSLNEGSEPMPISNKALSTASMSEAALAERERIKEIMDSEVGQSLPAMARHLAMSTDMPADKAIGCLLVSANAGAIEGGIDPTPFSQFMDATAPDPVGRGVNLDIRDDDDGASAASTTELAARLGLKGFAKKP